MSGRFVALKAVDDQRAAIEIFRREDRVALPVVDDAGALIGVVTVDDVLDTAQDMATRDLQRFGGTQALEHQLARALVLALFVPLIISSGGNAGSQASTLVIRAMALGEVALRDWWLVVRRELWTGAALGVILGTIGFCRIAGWSLFSDLYGPHPMLIAATVGIAVVGVVLWGVLVGAALPLVLRRFGFDPATSSAPFVATLVDVTGVVIYFSVGIVMLRGVLL
jgi:magnesium transporter